jgi:glycogen synthase
MPWCTFKTCSNEGKGETVLNLWVPDKTSKQTHPSITIQLGTLKNKNKQKAHLSQHLSVDGREQQCLLGSGDLTAAKK